MSEARRSTRSLGPALVLLLLAVAVVGALVLDPWSGTTGGPGEDARNVMNGAASRNGDGAGRGMGRRRAGPGLETRKEAPAIEHGEDTAAPQVLPGDLWTIEITEIVDTNGNPVRGADIYLDQARHTNKTWTFEGKPVEIHLRPWADDDERRLENWRRDYVACDETPVYISVRHEQHATWFAPALRYEAQATSRLRVVLEPRRKFSGTVLAQDGRTTPQSTDDVVLRAEHVPASMFQIEAAVGEDGRFAFDPEEGIPSGRLLIEASSNTPFTDGYAVVQEVGPDDEEVVLVLRRAHRFHLRASIRDEKDAAIFVRRRVRFISPEDSDWGPMARDTPVAPGWHGTNVEVLLPEGARETWQAALPGYHNARAELHATGDERDHRVELPLEPARLSGLLVLDIESPGPAMRGSVHLEITDPGVLRTGIPTADWRVHGVKRTKVAMRLPSGVARVIHLTAHVQAARSPPWIIPPFEVVLPAGGRIERHVKILEAGVLRIVRKRKGGFMPDLHVRLTLGSREQVKSRWFDTRDQKAGKVYGMFVELEAGNWTVELLRDGELLRWSTSVRVVAGKSALVRIPDDVVLPVEDR